MVEKSYKFGVRLQFTDPRGSVNSKQKNYAQFHCSQNAENQR